MLEPRVIGIDCATKRNKVGLALAKVDDRGFRLMDVRLGDRERESVADQVASWLGDRPSLLALDAPLGWPTAMAHELPDHRAGEEIAVDADFLFARETERFVRKELNRRPLEVGANLIARTAHSAIRLLCQLRRITQRPIPLAWEQGLQPANAAIEVYPAATLMATLGDLPKGAALERRQTLVPGLARLGDLGGFASELVDNPHLFDAAVCVLAGTDFLQGRCHAPRDLTRARKEGWIWFRKT